MRSAIFDFNGTLFSDSDKHKEAWRVFTRRYGKEVGEAELVSHFLGRANGYILHRLFGADLPEHEVARMTLEKEGIYRDLCRADPPSFHLMPGAEDFLDYLKKEGVRFTIATGSEVSNVDFYFKEFHLSRWFDRALVVFDDGTFPGKPAPDVYLRAAAVLGVAPEDCTVFEDSSSGVRAASSAGVGKIALISATWVPAALDQARETLPPVHCIAPDFTGMIQTWKENLSVL